MATAASAYSAYNANHSVAATTISDTAANISTSIANLYTLYNAGKITSITITDAATNKLTITASQADAYCYTVLSKAMIASPFQVNASFNGGQAFDVLSYTNITSVSITETAMTFGGWLSSYQQNSFASRLSSVTLTDITTTPIYISSYDLYNQVTQAGSFLSKVSGTFTLAVGTGTPVNASQAASIIAADSRITFIGVADTPTAIVSSLDSLNTIVNKLGTAGLTIIGTSGNGNALTLSSTQLINDYAVLGKINSATLVLTISNSVSASGTSAVLNAAAAISGRTVTTSMSVSDTAANIASNLNALQGNIASISAITQTDIGVALAISSAQLVNDSAALTKINSGSYTVAINDAVLVSSVASLNGNSHVISLGVSDSAVNISSNIDFLSSNISKITAITNNNSGVLSITATQLSNDSAVLSKISGGLYSLAVSGVSVSNAASVALNNHVNTISITDTSANIISSLSSLSPDSAKVTSIVFTDSNPSLSISASLLIVSM